MASQDGTLSTGEPGTSGFQLTLGGKGLVAFFVILGVAAIVLIPVLLITLRKKSKSTPTEPPTVPPASVTFSVTPLPPDDILPKPEFDFASNISVPVPSGQTRTTLGLNVVYDLESRQGVCTQFLSQSGASFAYLASGNPYVVPQSTDTPLSQPITSASSVVGTSLVVTSQPVSTFTGPIFVVYPGCRIDAPAANAGTVYYINSQLEWVPLNFVSGSDTGNTAFTTFNLLTNQNKYYLALTLGAGPSSAAEVRFFEMLGGNSPEVVALNSIPLPVSAAAMGAMVCGGSRFVVMYLQTTTTVTLQEYFLTEDGLNFGQNISPVVATDYADAKIGFGTSIPGPPALLAMNRDQGDILVVGGNQSELQMVPSLLVFARTNDTWTQTQVINLQVVFGATSKSATDRSSCQLSKDGTLLAIYTEVGASLVQPKIYLLRLDPASHTFLVSPSDIASFSPKPMSGLEIQRNFAFDMDRTKKTAMMIMQQDDSQLQAWQWNFF